MFKKILSFVLAVSVLLSMAVVNVHAEEVSAERVTNFENAVTLLEELGAIPQDSAYTFESEMTKGQFVEMLSKIIPVGDGSEEQIFDDVPSSHTYFKVIQGFADAGYIDGYAGSFGPDRAITYNEALYILMNTMGYGDFMNLVAAYPAGGWQLANQLDIKMKNKGACVGDIFYLVYQALTTDMLAIDGMKQGSFVFKTEEGKTILEQYHNIEVTTGILNNNGQMTINSQFPVEENAIVVDGEYYDMEEACTVLPGCEVDVFHDIDSDEVLCVVATAENEIIEINSADIEGFRDMKYYYETTSRKTLKIKEGTDIVINGQIITEIVDEDMVPANGKVIAIDNGTTTGVSVVIVKGYESFVVKSVVKDNNKVTLYADTASGIEPVIANLETNVPLVYDAEGNTVAIEDIKINDVVSVMGTLNDDDVTIADEIVLSDAYVSGDLNSISRGDDPAIVIDGVEYPVAASAVYILDSISPQGNMTFYIDFMGNIVELDKKISGGMAYGYILGAKLAYNDEGERVISVKVLSEIGSVITYFLSPERIYIDDVRSEKYYDPEEYLGQFTRNVKKVFRYDVNENREINKVDFSQDITTATASTVNNRLFSSHPKADLYFRKTYMTFSTKVSVNANTIVFKVPERPEDASNADYEVLRDVSKLADGRYTLEAYKLGEDSMAASVLVLQKNFKNYSDSAEYYVVKEVSQELDQYDEITYSVTICGLAGDKTYTVKSSSVVETPHAPGDLTTTYRQIQEGDIIRCSIDSTGTMIEDITICYQTEEGNALGIENIGSGTWNNASRIISGVVYAMDDSLISITATVDGVETNEWLADNVSETYLVDSFKIFKLSLTGDGVEIEVGTPADIKAFKTSGGDYSTVVAVTGNATGKLLFVIED